MLVKNVPELDDAYLCSLGQFWIKNDNFPLLKNIALDIISVPMTEISVERKFSHLNFILNKQRSCLEGENLDDIFFLRMNSKFSNNDIK
jgi:hypothetical protein